MAENVAGAEINIPDWIQKHVLDMLLSIVKYIDLEKIKGAFKRAARAAFDAFMSTLEAAIRNHEIEIGGPLHETVEKLMIAALDKVREMFTNLGFEPQPA